MRAGAFVVAGLLLCVRQLAGQDSSFVPAPGALLRVTAPSLAAAPLVGRVAAVEGSDLTLVLADSTRRTIPRAAVEHIEWGRPHGHAVQGFLLGALVGIPIGVAVDAEDPETGETGEYVEFAAIFAALCAIPAALIGSQLRTPGWTSFVWRAPGQDRAARPGQAPPRLQPGVRVRVRTSPNAPWLTGTVEAQVGDSLRVRAGHYNRWIASLALADLQAVQVRGERGWTDWEGFLALYAGPAAASGAEAPPALKPGARVRIRTTRGPWWVHGSVALVSADSLWLHVADVPARTEAMAWSDISAVELARAAPAAPAAGALIGAAAGVAAWVAGGFLSGDVGDPPGNMYLEAAAGAVGGALIGSRIARWESASRPAIALAAQRSGRWSLALRFGW